MGITYKNAGVDVEAGEEAIHRIKSSVRSTFNKNVLMDLGSFGGFYRFEKKKYRDPILVSSTDGVGTKLKVAILSGKYDTVGEDIVNHCVNDILVGGAEPLFFLDYFATGKLNQNVFESIISGMVRGCKSNGLVLIGGETAEMPDFYAENDFDIAGTIVGVVDKKNVIDGKKIKKGDVLVALPSTGLHTNGYSLARKVLLSRYQVSDRIDELGCTLTEALLAVHKSYLPVTKKVWRKVNLKGMSHITGGGIVGNTRRVLPKGLDIRVDWNSWPRPTIFKLIQHLGDVPEEDMRRTMNLGVGMIYIVSPQEADRLVGIFKKLGENARVVGEVVRKSV